jgi:hypothetical protein
MFIYPPAYQIEEIQQLYIGRKKEGRIGLDIAPMVEADTGQVRWEQKDNYYGLQQMRGMDGAPTRVVSVGRQVFSYDPGVYGEYDSPSEMELTNRSQGVSSNVPIDISDLVFERMDMLMTRAFDRIEYNIWTTLINGTISIVIGDPVTGKQYGYTDTYVTQTVTGTSWGGSPSTATPIQNFQTVQQLGVGYSVDLGAGATAYMNGATAYNLLNNTNNNDFGGRRDMFGATLNNLNQVNDYFQAQNLAKIVVYDQGYYPTIGGNTTGAFTKFIPNGKVLIIGKRPGDVPVAQYKMTKCAPNGYRPGMYSFYKDFNQGINCAKEVGKGLEIHHGHNGGMAVMYPSAVVTLTVI